MHRTQSTLTTSAVSAVVKVDTLAGWRSPRQPLLRASPCSETEPTFNSQFSAPPEANKAKLALERN